MSCAAAHSSGRRGAQTLQTVLACSELVARNRKRTSNAFISFDTSLASHLGRSNSGTSSNHLMSRIRLPVLKPGLEDYVCCWTKTATR
mmetsp:Transcript_37384/g.70192  ORF Transcript_37384/g.70192 Transcript_37384/m.70192 type:complete len:88 (-) Transcript_37384:99-362(-)